MNQQATSLHRTLPARGIAHSMRVAGPLLIAILLAGCATCPPGPTRTEISRVPTPVWLPIPERYIQPLELPGLPNDLDNEALERDASMLENLLDRAQQDRESLRRLNQQRGQGGE